MKCDCSFNEKLWNVFAATELPGTWNGMFDCRIAGEKLIQVWDIQYIFGDIPIMFYWPGVSAGELYIIGC